MLVRQNPLYEENRIDPSFVISFCSSQMAQKEEKDDCEREKKKHEEICFFFLSFHLFLLYSIQFNKSL
jgi:hypothetical protein